MKVLITGGAGYIGSVTVDRLLSHGYEVVVLDNLMYGNAFALKKFASNSKFTFVKGDVRKPEDLEKAMKDVDAVVHMAALVGAPACDKNKELTVAVNYEATKLVADLCQKHDVDRLLFASSTSVYGNIKDLDTVDEKGPVNPISLYAETKLMSEKYLLQKHEEEGLPACCLRVATNYGPSHRMRFDLVVNYFTYIAKRKGIITVHGGGGQWRPFIHVHDTARAYQVLLEAPRKLVEGEVYNVGCTEENYTIMDVAKIVKEAVPTARIVVEKEVKDPRSYRVSFEKIKTKIRFEPEKRLRDGVLDVLKLLETIENPEAPVYRNYMPE